MLALLLVYFGVSPNTIESLSKYPFESMDCTPFGTTILRAAFTIAVSEGVMDSFVTPSNLSRMALSISLYLG